MPPKDKVESVFIVIDDSRWLFGLVGLAKAERLSEIVECEMKRYGFKHFIFDHLIKFEIGYDGYSGQKALIDTIFDLKKLAAMSYL